MDIYKLTLENAHIGFWDQNIPEGKLCLSPAFKAMFGYADHELDNSLQAWQHLVFTEDQHLLFDDPDVTTGTLKYHHKNGSTIWVKFNRQVIERDAFNNPVRIIGSNTDISAQKNAEIELKATKNLLNEISQTAAIGGWEINLVNQKVTWTKGTYDIFELPYTFEPEFNTNTGEGFDFFKEGETSEKLRTVMQEAILFATPFNIEIQIKTATGKELWTRVFGQPDFKNGVCKRIYGTFQDIHYRVKIREELQISEQRFRGAFEYSPIGMALVSLTGQWLKVNKNLCDLLGYTEQELLQKNFQDITHPEDINHNQGLLNQLIAGDINNYQMEKRYFRKDGNTVWALLNVSMISDKHGAPLYLVSQIINITDRKNAEISLKESEAKYRRIFENVQDVFYQTDFKGNITEISPSIEKYSGYKRDELIGTNVGDFYYYPEDKFLLFENLMKLGKVTDFNARLKTQEAKPIYASINAHAVTDDTGWILAFEGSMRDINERKNAEDALSARDLQFTKLSNQVPGAIYQFQYFPDGRYFFPFTSKGMEQLLEVDMELIKSDARSIKHIIFPDDIKELQNSISNSIKTLGQWDFEFRVTLPLKGERWIKGQSTPETLEDGSILWHGYLTDTTDQKDREQELRATVDLVSEQNNRLINFAYIISHNLRTHSGNFEMLVNLIFDAEDEAEKQEYLNHLKKVSSQLSETILHLNDVVSIQTSIHQQRSKVKLHDYIEKTRDILVMNTGMKELDIKNEVPADLELDYNPAYIESILFNFLSNAIKYRHPGREPLIQLKTYFEETHLILEITDNGSGIDMERNADKLFGMYRTFHDNRDAKGIGLFITKNQIEAMGGRVEVISQVDVGHYF